MVQRRSGSGLPPKALQRLRIARQIVGQKFERDKPVQLRVLGLVNHAHPATAELLDDAVVRNFWPITGANLTWGEMGKSTRAKELAE